MKKYGGHFGKIGRVEKKDGLGTFICVCVGILAIICVGLYVRALSKLEPFTFVEDTQLLSITEIENQYNVEVLMPSPRELQEWCVRRGAPNVPIDDELGDLTEAGMDWVRCRQEASKHNYIVEKEFWQ